jgi:hypothetical protein
MTRVRFGVPLCRDAQSAGNRVQADTGRGLDAGEVDYQMHAGMRKVEAIRPRLSERARWVAKSERCFEERGTASCP